MSNRLVCPHCGLTVGDWFTHRELGTVCPACLANPRRVARRPRRLPKLPGPPERRVVVDAAFDAGIAGIAYSSAVLGDRAETRHVADSVTAELGAVLFAMTEAATAPNLVFLTDNRAAALLERPRRQTGPGTSERVEILERLSAGMEWELVHVPRSVTVVAHRIALAELRRSRPNAPERGRYSREKSILLPGVMLDHLRRGLRDESGRITSDYAQSIANGEFEIRFEALLAEFEVVQGLLQKIGWRTGFALEDTRFAAHQPVVLRALERRLDVERRRLLKPLASRRVRELSSVVVQLQAELGVPTIAR